MYNEFEMWLNEVLEAGLPANGTAINFNLYEEGRSNWSVQFIMSDCFDEDNEDWACHEMFSSGENLYRWKQKGKWDRILEQASEWIREYLVHGKNNTLLLQYQAVAVGFVDGDLHILHKATSNS